MEGYPSGRRGLIANELVWGNLEREFESPTLRQTLAGLHKKRDSDLALLGANLPPSAIYLSLKSPISAFFRACSSIRRAAHEENTNLGDFKSQLEARLFGVLGVVC